MYRGVGGGESGKKKLDWEREIYNLIQPVMKFVPTPETTLDSDRCL